VNLLLRNSKKQSSAFGSLTTRGNLCTIWFQNSLNVDGPCGQPNLTVSCECHKPLSQIRRRSGLSRTEIKHTHKCFNIAQLRSVGEFMHCTKPRTV
jgi:hypothetical protein